MYRSSAVMFMLSKKEPQNKKIHLMKFTQRTCTVKAFRVNGKGMLWVLFVTGVTGFCSHIKQSQFIFSVNVTQHAGKTHRQWMLLVRSILIRAALISRQPSPLRWAWGVRASYLGRDPVKVLAQHSPHVFARVRRHLVLEQEGEVAALANAVEVAVDLVVLTSCEERRGVNDPTAESFTFGRFWSPAPGQAIKSKADFFFYLLLQQKRGRVSGCFRPYMWEEY